MTREEFKNALNGFINELVPEDRELSEEDETNLCDQFGEAASDILNAEESDEEPVQPAES